MRALAVVEIDIFVQNGLQFLRCAIQVVIKRLLFSACGKRLADGIVVRRAGCGKGLLLYEALLNVRENVGCILCALVTVEHQILRGIPRQESVIKSSKRKSCVDGIRYAVRKYTP